MTVAAVVLAASIESALGDAEGQAAVRRIADVAWSGGAVPIIVVTADPDGRVATALAGAPVTLAEPAPAEAGPVGQIVRGIEVAASEIDDTDAALVWPARCIWVGPETVTSLIEAHGVDADAILRPTFDGEAGWPIVVPLAHLERLRAVDVTRMPGEIVDDLIAGGIRERTIDLGDPGVTHDRSVARAGLPPYVGPTEPPGGHVHEWGAEVADEPDDGPLDGPALAPYGAAEDPG